jgi:MFS family permease
MLEIKEAVRYEATLGQSTWLEMFTRYRKRTIVGITAQMFAQLNGINVISFYLPTTLASAGLSVEKSLLYTAANSIPYVSATVLTWWLADRWGRRPLLILGGKSKTLTPRHASTRGELLICCIVRYPHGNRALHCLRLHRSEHQES